jgi:hypothetical protein
MVLLNQGAGGGFLFGSNLLAAGIPSVGDFDGNGDQDVAVTNNTGVSVFLNQGDGSMVASGFTPVNFPSDGYPHPIAVADLNGDCLPDLVVPSSHGCDPPAAGALYALLGSADGGFQVTDLMSGGLAHPWGIAVVRFPGARPMVVAAEHCYDQLSMLPEQP